MMCKTAVSPETPSCTVVWHLNNYVVCGVYMRIVASYPPARSYYYIRSRLNGLVLDVEGDNRNPGARVIMWNQKPGNCDNQLWYDDFATSTIRSKLNDFCLDWDGNFFCTIKSRNAAVKRTVQR